MTNELIEWQRKVENRIIFLLFMRCLCCFLLFKDFICWRNLGLTDWVWACFRDYMMPHLMYLSPMQALRCHFLGNCAPHRYALNVIDLLVVPSTTGKWWDIVHMSSTPKYAPSNIEFSYIFLPCWCAVLNLQGQLTYWCDRILSQPPLM